MDVFWKLNLFYFTSLKAYLDTNLANEIRSSSGIKSEFIHSFVWDMFISSHVPDPKQAFRISSEQDIHAK